MKKKFSYRDQLLELAYIYDVKEIKEYEKRRKNLTSGQLELILKKNKIIIPKDFKTNFFKENFTKPLNRVSKKIDNFREDSSKKASKVSRQIGYLKEDSSRNFSRLLSNLWKSCGKIVEGLQNIFPVVGKSIYDFIGSRLTNVFNTIYNQKIEPSKVGRVVLAFFVVSGLITFTFSGYMYYKKDKNEVLTFKKQKKLSQPESAFKKEVKKPEPKPKVKKQVEEPKITAKKEPQKKKEKVRELILPDLNLKTQTVF